MKILQKKKFFLLNHLIGKDEWAIKCLSSVSDFMDFYNFHKSKIVIRAKERDVTFIKKNFFTKQLRYQISLTKLLCIILRNKLEIHVMRVFIAK